MSQLFGPQRGSDWFKGSMHLTFETAGFSHLWPLPFVQFVQWLSLCCCFSSYRSWIRVLIGQLKHYNLKTNLCRVRVAPLATNSTLHWLNWTPLINWYALKIRPGNSEIEQHFLSNASWIDVLCPGLIFWSNVACRERLNGETMTAYITVQHFRTKCFLRQK